ncbi:hypothetical protein JCM16307_11520 [Thermococcus prieurii]
MKRYQTHKHGPSDGPAGGVGVGVEEVVNGHVGETEPDESYRNPSNEGREELPDLSDYSEPAD